MYLLYCRWGVIFAYRSVSIRRDGLGNLLRKMVVIKTIYLNYIRNTVQPIRDYISKNNYLKPLSFERRLKSLVRSTTEFCNSHPNVIFIHADKGNVTVTLNKELYLNKIEDISSDTSSYMKIKKNPINTIEKTFNKTLKT